MSILFNNVYQGPPGPPEFEYPILYDGYFIPYSADYNLRNALSQQLGKNISYGVIGYIDSAYALSKYNVTVNDTGSMDPMKFGFTKPDGTKGINTIKQFMFSAVDMYGEIYLSTNGFLTEYSEYNDDENSSPKIMVEFQLTYENYDSNGDRTLFIRTNTQFAEFLDLRNCVSTTSGGATYHTFNSSREYNSIYLTGFLSVSAPFRLTARVLSS